MAVRQNLSPDYKNLFKVLWRNMLLVISIALFVLAIVIYKVTSSAQEEPLMIVKYYPYPSQQQEDSLDGLNSTPSATKALSTENDSTAAQGDNSGSGSLNAPQPDSDHPNTSDGNCNPNYSPCIPNMLHNLSCTLIGVKLKVVGSDVYHLDKDGDGIACDNLHL